MSMYRMDERMSSPEYVEAKEKQVAFITQRIADLEEVHARLQSPNEKRKSTKRINELRRDLSVLTWELSPFGQNGHPYFHFDPVFKLPRIKIEEWMQAPYAMTFPEPFPMMVGDGLLEPNKRGFIFESPFIKDAKPFRGVYDMDHFNVEPVTLVGSYDTENGSRLLFLTEDEEPRLVVEQAMLERVLACLKKDKVREYQYYAASSKYSHYLMLVENGNIIAYMLSLYHHDDENSNAKAAYLFAKEFMNR